MSSPTTNLLQADRANPLVAAFQHLAGVLGTVGLWLGLPEDTWRSWDLPGTSSLTGLLEWLPPADRFGVAESNEILVGDGLTVPSAQFTGGAETPSDLYWAAIPLRLEGTSPGVLLLARQGSFQEEPYLLSLLADQVAVAIQNARLYQIEHLRRVELSVLFDLSRAVTQPSQPVHIFHSAYNAVQCLMPVDAFVVSLIDRESRQSDIVYQIGDQAHVRSLISTPLHLGEETIGMISAQSYQPQAYQPRHEQLLQNVADHVTIAVENAHLFSSLEDRYQSVQEANRLRLEFIQNLSHELRTPLTFLTGYTELLLSGELGRLNLEQLETLSSIQSKTEMLVRLVEDLAGLDLSSPEWLNLRPTSLQQVLRDAVLIAEVNANEKGINISLDLPADFPPVQADPERLAQALRDLFKNAIYRCSPKSEIVVVLLDSQDRAVVSILNQGEALTGQARDRLLESFNQTEQRQTNESYGLAIARHIIAAHQGIIWIESTEGVGNAICFSLPYQPVNTAAREALA